MIRIPHLASLKTTGIHSNIESYCSKYNIRVIVEYTESPVVVIHATDLDYKSKETFYMDEDYFVMNAFILTWMKKKMYNVTKGIARERRHNIA